MSVILGPGRYTGTGMDPVGATEIAHLANVGLDTVKRWRERHSDFPQPDWTVGGRPAWRVGDVWAWLLRTGRLPATNEADQRIHDLADQILAVLRERNGGWVAHTELLALAPEGRTIVLTELEEHPFGTDDARGPAYDAGPSGRRDGSALENAIGRLRAQLGRPDDGTAYRIEDGYPDGGLRAFRLVTTP